MSERNQYSMRAVTKFALIAMTIHISNGYVSPRPVRSFHTAHQFEATLLHRGVSTSLYNSIRPEEDELEYMFDQIKDMDPEAVPQEMQDAIRDKISQNAPADWKIRLNLMGFNPLTIAGYILAAVIITCNNVFGAGWAGDALGMNDVVISDRTQIPQSRMSSNERFSNSYDGVVRTEVQTIELNSRENIL